MIDDMQDDTHGSFGKILQLCEMPLVESKLLLAKLPDWPERQSLLLKLLRQSSKSKTILFCCEDYLVLAFENMSKISYRPLHSHDANKKTPFMNEIVAPSATLRCDELRWICTSIEMLEFKCVHLLLKGNCPTYTIRSETAEQRQKHLKASGHLNCDEYLLAKELYKTRCGFAHSIVDVDKILFRSRKLKDNWGNSGKINSKLISRTYLKDAFDYSQKLLDIFKPVQIQQIDPGKFKESLCKKLG